MKLTLRQVKILKKAAKKGGELSPAAVTADLSCSISEAPTFELQHTLPVKFNKPLSNRHRDTRTPFPSRKSIDRRLRARDKIRKFLLRQPRLQ